MLRSGSTHHPHPLREPGPYRVLVVDDDPAASRLLRLSLELEGAEVTVATSLVQAHNLLSRPFDGVVLDRRLPDGDGLDLLPVLARQHPQPSVVVCSNLEDHAEPWHVLHVPKTDMERVVSVLGLIRGDHPGVVEMVGQDAPSGSTGLPVGVRLPEIVGRWAAALGRQLSSPPSTASHLLITQLVALDQLQASPEGSAAIGISDRREHTEVSVRRLVDLREQLTAELSRQLPSEWQAEVLAAVNRELDTWILGVVARDVERLRRRASTDALTGLLNRWAFDDALTEEVARSSRYGRPFSAVIVDLDGLKAINDSNGHMAGDTALVAMASAIRTSLRVSDSAYRVGGDEFVILLPETPKAVVPQVINRIQSAGAPPFSWGAATYLEDTDDSETVINLADQQLIARRQVTPGRS